MIVDSGLTPIVSADGVGDFSLVERRKEFGTKFPLWGGIGVRQIIEGERAIDQMVGQLFSAASEGGVFPTIIDRYGELIEIPLKNLEYLVHAFKKANGMT